MMPRFQGEPIESGAVKPRFGGQNPVNQQVQPEATPVGYGEAALQIASGVVAEPIAGIAGIASIPLKGADAGDVVKSVRDAMTYSPRTEGGKAAARNVADVLEPVATAIESAEGYLGERGYEAAGPVGGAVGGTLPTAALTLLGAKGMKTGRKVATTSKINRAMTEAAPAVDRLKSEARALYKKIDDSGTKVDDFAAMTLADDIEQAMKTEGYNARLHPKVSAVIDEAWANAEKPMTITELDTFRKVARGAAKSIDPSEARLGRIMLEKVDDFLDSMPDQAIISGDPAQASAMLKQARGHWGKARRAEIIDDAIEAARNQASGFENGLRVQFRQILGNRKKRMGFSADELDAMKAVVRGGKAENVARALGKFGFTEGQASSMLLGSLGVAGGAAVGGASGAVAVPLAGQVMRKVAQSLTRKNAKLARELVIAGKDGKKIVAAYLRNTPKPKRNVSELTGLLLKGDIPLDVLKKSPNKMVSDAAFLASAISAAKIPVDSPEDNELKQ